MVVESGGELRCLEYWVEIVEAESGLGDKRPFADPVIKNNDIVRESLIWYVLYKCTLSTFI